MHGLVNRSIKELLVSKIESGQIEIEANSFDLQTCIQASLDTVSNSATEKQIDLAARIAPEVPSSIISDSLRLQQVLVILLSNAVKYTSSGEVKLEVSSTAKNTGQILINFNITDSGIGITPAKLEHLSHSFQKEGNTISQNLGNIGTGLAICKRFVELMGGSISLKSKLGQGSTFSFQIIVVTLSEPTSAMTALHQLASELSPEDATSIASEFLDDLDEQIDTLREAIKLRNFNEAQRHAHSIKGSSSIFALTPLQEILQTIENASSDERIDDILAELPALQEAARESSDDLRSAISSITSTPLPKPMS